MLLRNLKRLALWPLVLMVIAVSPGCRTSPEAREAKYLKRGEALVAKKDYPRALLEFRNAVSAMPKDAEPHYRMGLVYIEMRDFNSAARAFQKAVGLNPKHTGAQLKLAEFMTLSRDEKLIQEAMTRVTGIFGSSPDNLEAVNMLAAAEWKLGKPEDAANRLEQALEKFPTHLESAVTLARMKLSRGDQNGAEQVLKKAATNAPQSSPAALALGHLYIMMSQPAKAESELKRAVQLDPKNGAALLALGAIQMAGNRIEEAEQSYKQLSALPDEAYKPLYAIFLYRTGKREAAVKEFEAQFQSAPNDREARTRLVAAYAGMKRISEAEGLLAAALKRNPKDTDALLQRAELRLPSGKMDDAENDLKQVISFQPNSASAHFLLARVYQSKGLASNQRQELQEAVRLNPAMLDARLALGTSFLAAKQPKVALETINSAPDSQKKQLPWMIARNWTLLSLGNLQEAKVGIDEALQGRPAEAVYQSAVFRFLKNDYPGARALLEELIKRNVTDAEVELWMETYAARQELPKGVDRLKELAAAHPDSASLQQLLGRWSKRAGNPTAARKAFESAKAIDRQFAPADISLAEMEIDEGRNEAALQRLTGVVAADPKNIAALLLSARAQEAVGIHSAVVASYREVLNLDDSNLIALNNLAYVLAADNPEEALKLAERAAAIMPDSPNVQDTLGWIYYRKGIYSTAVRYLKTAVDKESTPRREFHLGMSYLKAGDRITGQKIVQSALQKDPKLAKTEQGW